MATPSPERLKVVFLGTPQFSVPTLTALYESDAVELIAVVTQPDKPAGRGQKLMPPPIKQKALEWGLPCFQPKSIKKDEELQTWLRDAQPDFFVTVAFGQILSQAVLDIPKFGTVNVHASLLPEYRGANPIQKAILDGQKVTGITTMLTDIGVDTGDMLLKAEVPIEENTTLAELMECLSATGAPLLLETLVRYAAGEIQPIPQDHEKATHAPKITKEAALLTWSDAAEKLHDQIRGMNPWPCATTYIAGDPEQRIRMLQSIPCEAAQLGSYSEEFLKNAKPGQILGMIKDGIQVMTGNGVLTILTLQPPGKKPMSARDWLNGFRKADEPLPQFMNPTPAEEPSPSTCPVH